MTHSPTTIVLKSPTKDNHIGHPANHSARLGLLYLAIIVLILVIPHVAPVSSVYAQNPTIDQATNDNRAVNDNQVTTVTTATNNIGGIDLRVSPATAFIKLKPGSKASHVINLENTGSSGLVLSPIFLDFGSDNTSGLPALKKTFSFPYLSIPPGGFGQLNLPARGKAQLTLLFDVPASATEAEYPFTVVFQTVSPENNQVSPIVAGIGSNIVAYVKTQEQTLPGLQIEKLKAPRILDSFTPLSFDLLLKNPATGAQVASGSAQIYDFNQKQLANYTIYPDVILGSSSRMARSFSSQTPQTSDDLTYVGIPFKYNPGFLIGIYRLTIVLNNAENQTVTLTQNIIAFPIIATSLIAVGLGLIGFWAYLSRKRMVS